MNAVTRMLALAAATAVAVTGLVTAGLASAPAAQAAGEPVQPVQFSTDGIHWSDSYTDALFGGVLLVPGGSADRDFYVRNNAGEPANLRVTLYDVSTTDISLATAMSVSTSLPGYPGATVPVTSANPCATLSSGKVLADGESAKLDNVARLADLSGTTGQAHTVAFKLAISLSSTDSAAPLPNACPTDFAAVVIGSPDPGTGTASHPVYHLGAAGWTPVGGSASGALPVVPTTPTTPETLVYNTQRLYQENIVALWLAMAVAGVLLLLIVRRRRRDDDSSQYSSFREPTSQNGTSR